MKTTPAQQRLIAAAQKRRAMEYEKELAAWRAENGLAPAGNPLANDGHCRPVRHVQALWFVVTVLGGCFLSVLTVYWIGMLIVQLIGGTL